MRSVFGAFAAVCAVVLASCAPQDEPVTRPDDPMTAEPVHAFEIIGQVDAVHPDEQPPFGTDAVVIPTPAPERTYETPDDVGYLTVSVESGSPLVMSECNFGPGDPVRVWWTPSTFVDAEDAVPGAAFTDDIVGSSLSIGGGVFFADDDPAHGECILVAGLVTLPGGGIPLDQY